MSNPLLVERLPASASQVGKAIRLKPVCKQFAEFSSPAIMVALYSEPDNRTGPQSGHGLLKTTS